MQVTMIVLTLEEDSILRCSVFLIELDDEDYDKFLQLSYKKTFANKEFLLREGEINKNLYIILSGSVALLKSDDSEPNKNYLIETLGPGQTIGEMRLVHNRPCSLSVVAQDLTETICTPINRLHEPENYACFIALLQSTNRILSNRLFNANELLMKQQKEK